MTLLLQLDLIDRTTLAETTVELASDIYHASASGTWPAGQYPRLLDADSLRHTLSVERGALPETSVEFRRQPAGGETAADGLDGVEIVGATLIEVGDVTDPKGTTTTYTIEAPYRYAAGKTIVRDRLLTGRHAAPVIDPGGIPIDDEGTYIRAFGGKVTIAMPPHSLTRRALRTFGPWGPGLYHPAGDSARAAWEVYDPPGDATVMIRFLYTREMAEAGGTVTLAGNGDWRLQVIDGAVRGRVNHATTNAVVDSPKLGGAELSGPERFYVVWMNYDASELEVELYTWPEGDDAPVSHGTDAGTGALTASGLTWQLGSNQGASSNYYEGLWSDFAVFTAIIAEATMRTHIVQGMRGAETSLYAWIEGEMELGVSLIDSAVDVDKGGGLVGIPATGHVFGTTGGNVVVLADTDGGGGPDYDGRHVLDSTTSTNELVITATYIGGTFSGSPTVTGPVTVFDKAEVNQASRRDATPFGCLPGPTFGSGIADSPGAEPQEATDTTGGAYLDHFHGPVAHVLGRQIGYDPLDTVWALMLHGDHRIGVSDLINLSEGGAPLTIATRVTSMLAMMAATLTGANAAIYPGMGVSQLRKGEGQVAGDISGSSLHIKGLYFDGDDDVMDLGTSKNSVFIADHSIRIVVAAGRLQSGATQSILSNYVAGGNGIDVRLVSASAGTQVSVVVDHATFIANPAAWIDATTFSGEILITTDFTVDGSNTDFTVSLYLDGLLADSDSSSVPTVSLVAPARNLTLGARHTGGGSYDQYTKMYLSEYTITDDAKSAAWAIDKLGEALWHRCAAEAVVSLDSGAAVGFPCASHPWSDGDVITGVGFAEATYNADLTVDGDLSTDTMIGCAVSFVAETLTGDESFHDAGISEHWHGGWEPQGTANYPAGTWPSSIGSATGTITGATWRSGGVPPTSARAVVKSICVRGGVHGRDLDFSATGLDGDGEVQATTWPDHAIGHCTRGDQGEGDLTYLDMIYRVLDSFEGWVRVNPDGTLTFGRHVDPFSTSMDHSLPDPSVDTDRQLLGIGSIDDGAKPPWEILTEHSHVHQVEGTATTGSTSSPKDRNRWGRPYKSVPTPVPNAQVVFPAEGEPLDTIAFWATRAGAAAAGDTLADYLQYRRRSVSGVELSPPWWRRGHPDSGRLLPGEFITFTHPELGTVKATIMAVGIRGEQIEVDVGRIRLA